MYLYLKALHIVSVISWMAGLLYIGRLFIYLTEVNERPEPDRTILTDQLLPMARRLWFGISWPASISSALFGFWMASYYLAAPPTWLLLKLVLVGVLAAYHLACHWLYGRLAAGAVPWSSRNLRIWNEVATLLMVAIVFVVTVKDALSLLYGVVGLVLFAAALMAGIALYARVRAAGEPVG